MVSLLEKVEKCEPDILTAFLACKCFGITDQDEAVSGPGDQHVEPLGLSHEPDISRGVTPREGGHDNITFLALVII